MPDETPPDALATESAAPPLNDGPWAKDIQEYFESDVVRAQVDKFLREKTQPHITQLEQDSAPARGLWNDLIQNPADTVVDIVADMFGQDVAERVAASLTAEEAEAIVTEAAEEQQAPAPAEIPAEYKEMYEQWTAQQQRTAYAAEVERIKGEYPALVEDLFHPFVVTANGDFTAALDGYKRFEQRSRESFGPADPPKASAPRVLNGDGTASAPVIEKKYGSIADALDATLDDLRAARAAPPTLGSV